jgi:hypothetical protein
LAASARTLRGALLHCVERRQASAIARAQTRRDAALRTVPARRSSLAFADKTALDVFGFHPKYVENVLQKKQQCVQLSPKDLESCFRALNEFGIGCRSSATSQGTKQRSGKGEPTGPGSWSDTQWRHSSDKPTWPGNSPIICGGRDDG